MMRRIGKILYALDCFLFMLFTIGAAYVGESFSSAAYRSELNNGWYGRIFRPIIDMLAGIMGDYNHCKRVYLTAKEDLPSDMR